MADDRVSDADLDAWLNTLGLTTLAQWDVLVFLYHHQVSLVGAHLIAHLLGYANEPVVAALDGLEFLGLVSRSRVSQMVRLYQVTVPDDPERHEAWARLLAVASDRAGRMRLAGRLRGGARTAEEARQEVRGLLTAARRSVEASRQGLWETRHTLTETQRSLDASRQLLPPQQEGDPPWPQAS
jgi:DNA-binding MarR family transcriptional regulator